MKQTRLEPTVRGIQQSKKPKGDYKELPKEIDWRSIQVPKSEVSQEVENLQNKSNDFQTYMEEKLANNQNLQNKYKKKESKALNSTQLKSLPDQQVKNSSQLSNSTNASQKNIGSTNMGSSIKNKSNSSQCNQKPFKISTSINTNTSIPNSKNKKDDSQSNINFSKWTITDAQKKNIQDLQNFVQSTQRTHNISNLDQMSEQLKYLIQSNTNSYEQLSSYSKSEQLSENDIELLKQNSELEKVQNESLQKSSQLKDFLKESEENLCNMNFSELQKRSLFLTQKNKSLSNSRVSEVSQASEASKVSEAQSENLSNIEQNNYFVQKNIQEAFLDEYDRYEKNQICNRLENQDQEQLEKLISEGDQEIQQEDPFKSIDADEVEITKDVKMLKDKYLQNRRIDQILQEKMEKVNEQLIDIQTKKINLENKVNKKFLNDTMIQQLQEEDFQPSMLQKYKIDQFIEIQKLHQESEQLLDKIKNQDILKQTQELQNNIQETINMVQNGEIEMAEHDPVKEYISEVKEEVQRFDVDINLLENQEEDLQKSVLQMEKLVEFIYIDESNENNDNAINEIQKQIEENQRLADQYEVDQELLKDISFSSDEDYQNLELIDI